ncbi:MAG: RNA polymerase sigma factor RpoD, partial [Rhodospirillales bacterium]|nr:RNA polymerase sigma factor RpoD [Rhodospirillales bacterium]
MVALGKERGYVTYDELNEALPPDEVSSEQIEDTMAMLSEQGINVVENEEQEDTSAEKSDKEESETTSAAGNVGEADIGRTDDPVRMYLREMGSVELLSREGEIAIAKRIEAGREMMIGGLMESPLTIRAIVDWHDALIDERILLRDIIDLDATYGGGPNGPAVVDNSESGESAEGGAIAEAAKPVVEVVKPPEKPAPKVEEDDDDGDERTKNADEEDDDEGDEVNLSLAVLEAKLTPTVIETFEQITKTYKKLHRAQD